MASSADVHVRICAQEIIKYDLEIKALIQVRNEERALFVLSSWAISEPLVTLESWLNMRTEGLQVELRRS